MKKNYVVFWLKQVNNIGDFDDSHTVLGESFGWFDTEYEAIKEITKLSKGSKNPRFTILPVYSKQ